MRRLSAKIGRPVTFALLQVDAAPELWRELMDASLAAADEGADLWPQVAGRATGLLSGHHTTYSLFDVIPAYQQLKARNLSEAELIAAAARSRGARRRSSAGSPTRPPRPAWRTPPSTPSCSAIPPDYEPSPDRSLAAMAASPGALRSRWPTTPCWPTTATACSTCRSSTTRRAASTPSARCCCTRARRCGLADGGAHCGVICDASIPTFMLTHWTRDRDAGRDAPARVGGQASRPTTRLGSTAWATAAPSSPACSADLNVIDYDALALGSPRRGRRPARPGASGWCRARRATSPPSSRASSRSRTAKTPAPAPACWSAAPAERSERQRTERSARSAGSTRSTTRSTERSTSVMVQRPRAPAP